MNSQLERTWWFAFLVNACTVLAALSLMGAAGIGMQAAGLAQWAVFALCLASLNRIFSFLIWLAVLLIAPSAAGTRQG